MAEMQQTKTQPQRTEKSVTFPPAPARHRSGRRGKSADAAGAIADLGAVAGEAMDEGRKASNPIYQGYLTYQKPSWSQGVKAMNSVLFPVPSAVVGASESLQKNSRRIQKDGSVLRDSLFGK